MMSAVIDQLEERRGGARRYRLRGWLVAALALATACSSSATPPPPAAASEPAAGEPSEAPGTAVARGAYLVAAAGCARCHGDGAQGGAPFAGGKAIPSRFGTFWSRNITPDLTHGIGGWTNEAFVAALRTGISPEGERYFPTFPFTSFTGMTDRDILDIRAYLRTQPAVPQDTHHPPEDVPLPLRLPFAMALWRALYFREGPLAPDPGRSAEWNRGAYLANAVVHCGECHTPRNWLGAREEDRRFGGGTAYGAEAKHAPNITPDPRSGIGTWRLEDIETLLQDGMTPSGDFVAAPMSDVVKGTAKLDAADRRAIAAYLKSLPPLSGKGG